MILEDGPQNEPYPFAPPDGPPHVWEPIPDEADDEPVDVDDDDA